jgi:TonB-linked SusC/RagA family outer membrane protein
MSLWAKSVRARRSTGGVSLFSTEDSMRSHATDAVTVLTLALGALLFATPLVAQTGTVTGTARDGLTGAPVFAAQVMVEGTSIQTLTRADGRYSLTRVPAGQQTIRVRVLGYEETTQTVMVAADETVTLDFQLESRAVALSGIVVTGTIGATEQAKLPFTVNQLRGEDLPVTQPNFATAIRGKVAGATVVQGSGRPGAAPSVLLRGATSINAQGRDQEPLYIVDGVILGSSVVDIDALDIENIEIVKGAAAASLYGSRAANGVVVISTQRGSAFDDGTVRYTARSSFGISDIEGEFPLLRNHFWRMNEAGTSFVRADDSECTFRGTPGWDPDNECPGTMPLAGQRAGEFGGASPSQWNTFATNAWPGGTFDHVDQFFDGGRFMENYISASGRQGATNFHVSFSQTDDEGPMLGQEGFQRRNFRLNLDQVIRPDIHVSASAFYSNSAQQGFPEGSGNPLFDLTRMMAGVDLRACEPGAGSGSCLDDPDQLLLNVNPTNAESPNPLYPLLVRETETERSRILASGNVQYSPRTWFDIDGDVSYDRLDIETVDHRPVGFRTLSPSNFNVGTLSIANTSREALNASVTASFSYDLTDRIRNRTRVRYSYERQDIEGNSAGGYEFGVAEVPTLGNLNQDNVTAASSMQSVIADGYFFITNFDIADRYIIDGLIRNDGSSLFGADERRHWYGRIAGAWRMAQESWFQVDGIDEFKLRYSVGSAGGRPSFTAQYETFSVAGGVITPISLGNRDLKPEHSVEHEVGIDMGFAQRFDASLTYARTETENQILAVPLPAFTGFSSRVMNVGTLESNTWEASLGASLVQTPELSWSARLLYDQTRSTITQLDVAQFRYGVPGQNMTNVFVAREGERIGTFYGPIAARSCDHLPEGFVSGCDEFVVDQNGYLVWVGSGGSLSDNAWGTQSPDFLNWGTPFAGHCADDRTGAGRNFCPVGNTMPDYTVSLSSNLDWRGFSLYGLIEAVQGFDVYNQPLQWSVFRDNVSLFDQSGIPENEQKPIGYWRALYGGLGGLIPNSEFVEDGSFMKLRELSLRYRFNAEQLSGVPGLGGFSGLALSVSGRNLMTWSDYRGYDPEVGRAGGATGSAALARVDGYNYPNFRTWTFGAEVNF